MAVRAKFWVEAVTKRVHGSEVTLRAVCRGDDNKKWSAATPVGVLTMSILNDLAAKQFEPGQEFFIDFTPAPKDKAGMGDD